MKIYLSKKEVQVLKKILPTVKLNAYNIQAYQNIMTAINNALDYIPTYRDNKPTSKSSYSLIQDDPIEYTNPEKEVKPESNIEKQKPKKYIRKTPVLSTPITTPVSTPAEQEPIQSEKSTESIFGE